MKAVCTFFRQQKARLLIAVATILLMSCRTVNVKPEDYLNAGKDEGYYLAVISVTKPGWTVSLFPRTTKHDRGAFGSAVAVFQKLEAGDNLVCIKLPKGVYSLQYAYFSAFCFEMEPIEVSIESGKICYAGNLEIDVTNASKNFPAFRYRYVDSREKAEKQFAEIYPLIAARYEFTDCAPAAFLDRWRLPVQRI